MSGDLEHSALSSSLTDMMTSLMVIFVLLLVNYLGNRQEAITVARNKPREMENMLITAFQENGIEGINYESPDPYTLIVIVPNEKFNFGTGTSTLNEGAKVFLQKFIPLLLKSFMTLQNDINLVNIEGHTDWQPCGDKYCNWVLSQSRAIEVMKYIFDFPAEVQEFKKIALFGGRGPIECERTDEEMNKNNLPRCRTVKFKIRFKSSEEGKS
jgi:outer membrane protein OmpA-like peptidoglycan-associated protein